MIGTQTQGTGLLVRIPESKLQDIEKSEAAKKKEEEDQNKPEIISLASNLKNAWQAALTAKQSSLVEQRLLSCLRQKNGEYDPEKLVDIRNFGGSEVFMMLTNIKCRAAESWIRDVLLPPGDKPWGIAPTPIPDLPGDETMQIAEQVKNEAVEYILLTGNNPSEYEIEARLQDITDNIQNEKFKKAKKIAHGFELKIEDDLREGSFYKALSEFITDIVIFPTAFIKGPIARRRNKIVWTEDQNGKWVPAVDMKVSWEYSRVSPLDMYPGPGSKSLQDGYFFERAKFRRSELAAMIGVDGFKESSIRAVLSEYGTGGLRNWLAIDQERADAEDRPQEYNDPDPPIDCLIYWGSAQGKTLIEWGMSEKKITDPDLDYQINAYLIGNYVIMARINPHPLGHRNYYCASYDSTNDSIWGHSPPELMRDCQQICNAVARALVNNLGIASGPMAEVYMNRIAPGENVEEMHPWKIFKTEDDGNGTDNPAVHFFQPDPLSELLMRVYEYFFKQSSEQAGIPAYIYGSDKVGGGGDTASGLSMLMNAATKTLKGVIAHIDEKVIKPLIKEHWYKIMLYDDEIEKAGDVNIVARASEHLIIQEQMQIRRNEMLNNTNNDWDRAIIGDKGRAKLLREAFESLKMDADDIVPTEQEMDIIEKQARAEVMNPQMPPEVPPAAVIDAAGGARGNEPGRMMQPIGLNR